MSSPVSIRVPPDGLFTPFGSGLVLTSALVPRPLHTYDVPAGRTSSVSSAPLPFASIPNTSLVPPYGQCSPAGSGTASTSAFAPSVPCDPESPEHAANSATPTTNAPRNRDSQRSRMMVLQHGRNDSTSGFATHVPVGLRARAASTAAPREGTASPGAGWRNACALGQPQEPRPPDDRRCGMAWSLRAAAAWTAIPFATPCSHSTIGFAKTLR